jgi:hypothetical protein
MRANRSKKKVYKPKPVSAYETANEVYKKSMMPKVSFSIGMTDRGAKIILTLPNSSIIGASAPRTGTITNAAGEVMTWFKEGVVHEVSLDVYRAFYNSLNNEGVAKGLRPDIDWCINTEPLDRYIPPYAIGKREYSLMWRNGLQWRPLAEVRLPYLASLLCDIFLGFGVDNLLPAYVILEIFDYLPKSGNWQHIQKINMIIKIHKSMQRLVVKRGEMTEKKRE